MPRLTTRDFDAEVMQLFDQYVHGRIDRRGFLDGASRFATSAVSAAMLLEALSPKFALAQQVEPDDARLATLGRARFAGRLRQGARLSGAAEGCARQAARRARHPREPRTKPAHRGRGAPPRAGELCVPGTRRAVSAGRLSRRRGPGARGLREARPGKTLEDFFAAAEWLRGQSGTGHRVGAVGFCYGGTIANLLAVRLPRLAAAVPFYGGSQPVADAGTIKAALMIHNAEKDPGVGANAAAYEQALQAAGVRHEAYVYPNTLHGFHNDTTPRYDEAAAKLAWQRTVAFLDRHLRG